MAIIDFRFRPPISNFLTGWLYDIDRRQAFAPRWGSGLSQSAIQKSLALCIQEMEDLDIIGVVPGRKSFGNMDNGDLVQLKTQSPDRFICLAGIDPGQDIARSLNEIDQYVLNNNCTGVNIEPGYCKPQITVDDERMYPIYEKCQKENIPMLLAFGGLCYSSLRYMMPQMIDKVAEDFPDLKIVLAHGGFPWVHAIANDVGIGLIYDIVLAEQSIIREEFEKVAILHLQEKTALLSGALIPAKDSPIIQAFIAFAVEACGKI